MPPSPRRRRVAARQCRALRGLGERSSAGKLHGNRCSLQPIEAPLERVAQLECGRHQLANALRAVLLQRAHDRPVEHRARLEAELDSKRPRLRDELASPGQQPEPRADRAVLVEAGCARVHAQLERPRVPEDRGADARAACVVDEHRDPALARRGRNRLHLVERERVVRDREAREDDRVGAVDVAAVVELAAGPAHRPRHGRMRVAGRDTDDAPARRDEHLHRRKNRGRQSVRDEDVVALAVAAEMIERELAKALPVESRPPARHRAVRRLPRTASSARGP